MPHLLNPRYRGHNLIAYNFAGFAAVAFVVFLLASQPFYLTDVLGLSSEKVGSAIGTLGVVDELTVVICAPLLGALNDRINAWAFKRPGFPSGPRLLQLTSFSILALALMGYGKGAWRIFPDLWFWRIVFAMGVTGTMSIMTVMLHEANNSDFDWRRVIFWRPSSERPPFLSPLLGPVDGAGHAHTTPRSAASREKNGRLSALLGVSTGLGAVFSVSVFLTLPVRLSGYFDLSREYSLRLSYLILGGVAFVVGIVVYFAAYDSVKQKRESSRSHEEPSQLGYFALLRKGVQASRNDHQIQLAYAGAFVARSTTVATSVFIPLVVYKYYSAIGACGDHPNVAEIPNQSDCYDGYIFLAILTGVAQVVALVSSPLWGIVADIRRLGSRVTLAAASIFGGVGSFCLCIFGSTSEIYDPRRVSCFVWVSLIGLSQIGTIISSMSLLSQVGQRDSMRNHQVIGSISGIYSLCGGVGILLITKIGGTWSDIWVFGPFLLLGIFNVLLTLFAVFGGR